MNVLGTFHSLEQITRPEHSALCSLEEQPTLHQAHTVQSGHSQ